MIHKLLRIPIYCFFLLAAFFPKYGFSDYIEGIDTTDVNGYGLDSAFQIGSYGNISGKVIAYFFVNGGGYFNYAFEDIKMAPSIPKQPYLNLNNYFNCIIIKRNKDTTYSKVQLLKQLSGKQYVYRYGKNTTPNDRMLIKSDYDRSVRYKPNNLFNLIDRLDTFDSTSWEAPLPNENHLLGYIFYRSKGGVNIDTTVPVNPAQWDSIAFIDTTCSSKLLPTYTQTAFGQGQNQYFNLVAVYAEGKSDFLLGWTRYQYANLNTMPNLSFRNWQNERIVVKKEGEGFLIKVQSLYVNLGSSSLSIYNINGQQIARFAGIKSNSIFWNTSNQNLSEGLYIMKAELPDKSVLSQKFMFSR